MLVKLQEREPKELSSNELENSISEFEQIVERENNETATWQDSIRRKEITTALRNHNEEQYREWGWDGSPRKCFIGE